MANPATGSSDVSRRKFLAAAGATGASALAGCTNADSDAETSPSDAARSDDGGATTSAKTTGATEASELVRAVEREAVTFEPTASSEGLDAVATRLADSSIVGIGESSHGVREFKRIAHRLVRRLVADHGYRLVAIEGTLGDFAPVNAYVTEGEGDLDAALSSLDFYFWRTPAIKSLFEWLREFNEGRDPDDRVVVRGYDAQFYDVNANAVRSYLRRVDPDYLSQVDDSLQALTTPIESDSPSAFATDSQLALIADLEARLRTRETEYVERSSRSAWRLAKRHVWTLERGLRFSAKSAAEEYARGKEIRDGAMADNVAWLREWTNADRAVVMGSVNHTMRSPGGTSDPGTRMGQHLTAEFGSDYYSLAMLFGTGAFAVPANHAETEFEAFDLGGPVDGTPAATFATASDPPFYLDFETARERAPIDSWLADTSKMQVSLPRRPQKGAIGLPEAPRKLVDGVVFAGEVSAAEFSPPK